MGKRNTVNFRAKVEKVVWNIADYFSDFKNPKSIPFTTYEVEIPVELKEDRDNRGNISRQKI